MKRDKLEKIYSGKDRVGAVHLFCKECSGYAGHRQKRAFVSESEATRLVRECTVKKCPLYPYRYSKKEPVDIDWL